MSKYALIPIGLFSLALVGCGLFQTGDQTALSETVATEPAATAKATPSRGKLGVINVVDTHATLAQYGRTALGNEADQIDSPLNLAQAMLDQLDRSTAGAWINLSAPAWSQDSDADLSDPTQQDRAVRDAYLADFGALCFEHELTGIVLLRSPDASYPILDEPRPLEGFGIVRIPTPVGDHAFAYATIEAIRIGCETDQPLNWISLDDRSDALASDIAQGDELSEAENKLLASFLTNLTARFGKALAEAPW